LDTISNGVAESARLVSDDTNVQVDSGAIYAQGATASTVSTVKGSWAFGMQGVKLDSSNGEPTRGARAGYLTLDGTGKVSAGELDQSQDAFKSGILTNSYSAQESIVGTYTVGSGGRGTLALNVTSNGTQDYIFYVAGANQILLLSSNAGGQGGSAIMAGKAYLRTTTAFSNATLSGTSVAVGQSLSNTNAITYSSRLIKAGILTSTGKGTYSETYDQNDAGAVSFEQTSSGTYSVDAEGRATLNGTSPSTFAYLVGTNHGFTLRGNLGVDFGYFESQTVPTGGFISTSFDGGYSDGSLWYGFEEQKAKSGEIVSSGADTLTGTFDVDPILNGGVDWAPEQIEVADPGTDGPIALYQTVGETYAPAATGRFLVRNKSLLWEALYFVSPTKAYAIDISGAPWQPLEEINHQ
jgi:hypothetical protein